MEDGVRERLDAIVAEYKPDEYIGQIEVVYSEQDDLAVRGTPANEPEFINDFDERVWNEFLMAKGIFAQGFISGAIKEGEERQYAFSQPESTAYELRSIDSVDSDTFYADFATAVKNLIRSVTLMNEAALNYNQNFAQPRREELQEAFGLIQRIRSMAQLQKLQK